MRSVPVGTKGTYSLVVQSFHLASQFKDSILPPVFATPMMVLFMENAALNAVRAFLEPGCSKRAGPTAPAKGLFLVRVDYEG